MTTKVKGNRINFKGKTVLTGIEMHKHTRRITALIEEGIVSAVSLARPDFCLIFGALDQRS